MKPTVLALSLAVLYTHPAPLNAQSADDLHDVVRASLHAVAQEYTGRSAVAAPRDSQTNALLRKAELGLPLVEQTDVLACTVVASPVCVLGEVDALINVGFPRVLGEHAEVYVGVTYRSARDRDHMSRQMWSVRLERSGRGWKVVDKEVVLSI